MRMTGRVQSKTLQVLTLIVLATLTAYVPAIFFGGWVWDDDQYITANPTLRSPRGLWEIWTQPKLNSDYYPLALSTHWLEYQLWGLRPLPYHLLNVLLHAGVAITLWRLLARLKIPGSAWAALLFALHPVQVESVAWITERKTLLSALLMLLALHAWLREHRKGFAASLGFYLLAILAKTTVVTLPAALLLIDWLRGRLTGRRLWRYVPFVLVGLPLGLFNLWMQTHHIGAQGREFELAWGQRLLLCGKTLAFYAAKLAWPVNLSFIYPKWEIRPAHILWLVLVVAIVMALWLTRRRIGKGPAAVALFYIAMLAPALGFLNIYWFRYSYVADHVQYVASMGLIALAAAILVRIKYLPLLVALPLAVLTWRQAGAYENALTLWRDTERKNPASWMVQSNLGNELRRMGREDEALRHYLWARELAPDQPETHLDVGTVYAARGHFDEALACFAQALAADPGFARAPFAMGQVYLKQGKTAEALQQFRKAAALRPDFALAQFGIGTLLEAQGDHDGAVAAYRAAVRANPYYVEAHYNLANALRETEPSEAERLYRRVIWLMPDHAEAHVNLGALLLRRGDAAQALRVYARAVQLNPAYRPPVERTLAPLGLKLPK